jgi:hypothetical protein
MLNGKFGAKRMAGKPTPLEEGELAALQGELASTNPYPIGSEEHAEWEEGYRRGKDADEEAEPKDDDA